jgi:predicted O-linked N-acetylglucosamine transferase (SPINDLY family)
VAYSLLHDVGLPQYATHDLAGYSALALRLANDAQERDQVKTYLQQKLREKAWPPSDSIQAQALMKTLLMIEGAPAP